MSSSSTVDPNTWQSLDLSKKGQEQLFMRQLVQYFQYINSLITNLNSRFTAANIASMLNGSNLLTAGAMTVNTQALGSKTTAFTFDCQGALISMFSFTQAGAYTVTLANLPIGALVFIAMTFSGTHTLTMAASTPASVAYSSIKLDYASVTAAGGNINLITPGTTFPAAVNNTMMMLGAAMTGPALNFLCQ